MTKIKEASSVIIDFERCKGCELCVYYCPKKCIVLSKKFNRAGHHLVEIIKSEDCNSCGICYIICPEYAITIK